MYGIDYNLVVKKIDNVEITVVGDTNYSATTWITRKEYDELVAFNETNRRTNKEIEDAKVLPAT